MLVRAHPGTLAGCAQLWSMVLSAITFVVLEDTATYVLCCDSLMGTHDGHDSIQALF